MELDKHSLFEVGDEKDGGNEGSGYCKDGEDVPGAFSEPVPRETNDADDNISNEDDREKEKDVI